MAPGAEAEFVVEYSGGIDHASVDAPEEVFTRESTSVFTRNLRRFLGRVPAFLEPTVVALGTDAAWYPDPAMQFGHDYPDQPRPSFAPSSLRVTLPEGWRAASAGRREVAGRTASFETQVPVPALSLNAGPFDEVSAEIAGRTFRLLYRPDHARNVELFSAAAPLLKERIADRLEGVLSATGLEYPHPELTVVEVPQSIAGFSPGWASPNRLAAPGVVMAREGQLFGGRFEFPLKRARARFQRESGGVEVSVRVEGAEVASTRQDEAPAEEAPAEAEGGEEGEAAAAETEEDLTAFDEPRAKLDVLMRFMATDWTGGNVERAAFKSCWDFRLRAVGAGAPVAGAAFSSYLAELGLGVPSVETPEVHRMFTNNAAFGRLIQATARGNNDEVAQIVITSLADLDDIYQALQETPLTDLEPTEDPAVFLGVLYFKGREPLRALRETLGRERFVAAVGELLEAHAGAELSWTDFREAFLSRADEADRGPLGVLFDNWLEGTELPGFVVTRPVAVRLAGEQERWQVSAVVANRGTAPGPAKLTAGSGDDARSRLVSLGPGEEVEVGLVVPDKPRSWRLTPYLALNRTEPRGSFDLREEPEDREPFDGVRPVEVVGELEPVVVDNLDPGFTVTLADGREVAWGAREGDEDELPKLQAFGILRSPKRWSRWRSEVRRCPSPATTGWRPTSRRDRAPSPGASSPSGTSSSAVRRVRAT
jgi:hypothetical protein